MWGSVLVVLFLVGSQARQLPVEHELLWQADMVEVPLELEQAALESRAGKLSRVNTYATFKT